MDTLYTKVLNWFSGVEGTYVDMDGKYGAQCVDLAKHYAVRVHGVPNIAYGHGKDFAHGVTNQPGWTFISPSSNAIAGDVVSFGPSWGDGYGHVAVVVSDNGDSLTVIQQNPKAPHKATLRKSDVVGYARPPRPAEPTTETKTHTVKEGETYWSISRLYGTTVAILQDANPTVSANNLYGGLKIKIPATANPVTSDSAVYHTVRAGESLWSIATKYSTPLSTIKKLNPNIDANVIYPNQKIRIS